MNALTKSGARLWNLGRLFAISQARSVIVTVAASTATLLAAYLIAVFAGGADGSFTFHAVFFQLFFVIIGFIATSQAFTALHKADRSYAYLTLPASHLEKTLEKLLLSTVVYVLAAILTYFVFSALAMGLTELIAGRSYPIFNPGERWVWEMVRNYVILQSIFLFGGAYFRSKHFIKTVLAVTGLFLFLAAFTSLTGWLFFGDVLRSMQQGTFEATHHFTVGQIEQMQNVLFAIRDVADFLFKWIMAPFLWVLTWLRLREAEVSDAV
jgi:hypothetical protein